MWIFGQNLWTEADENVTIHTFLDLDTTYDTGMGNALTIAPATHEVPARAAAATVGGPWS